MVCGVNYLWLKAFHKLLYYTRLFLKGLYDFRYFR